MANKTFFQIDLVLSKEQVDRIKKAVGDRLYMLADKKVDGMYTLSYASGRPPEDVYNILAEVGVTAEIEEEYEGFSFAELSVIFVIPGKWKRVYYQRPTNPFK